MLVWKLAFRNIFRHKGRSFITLSAIACGGVAIIFVGGFFDDTFQRMRESYIHNHTGHLQITQQGFLEHGRTRPYAYLIDDPERVVDLVRPLAGVRLVTPLLRFSGMLSNRKANYSCVGAGVVPGDRPMTPLSTLKDNRRDQALLHGGVLESGAPLDEKDPYGVLLGEGLASRLKIRVGDAVVMMAGTTGGSLNALDLKVLGTFSTGRLQYDNHFVRLPFSTAQDLLRTRKAQALLLFLNKTEDTILLKGELERLFDEHRLPLEIKTWRELNEFYVRTETLFNRIFFVLKVVVVIILVLGVYNTMTMAVRERIPEIGTLMAMGTKRKSVVLQFLSEGCWLGLLGGLGGIVVGTLFTWGIAYVGIPMPPPPGANMDWVSEPVVGASSVALGFFLSFVAAVISSFLAAVQGTRMEIASALRHTN